MRQVSLGLAACLRAGALPIAFLSGPLCLTATLGCGDGSAEDAEAEPDLEPPEVLVEGPESLPQDGIVALRVAAWRDGEPAAGELVQVKLNASSNVFSGRTQSVGTADVRFRMPEAIRDSARIVIEVGPPDAPFRVTRNLPVRAAARPLVTVDHARARAGSRVRVGLLALHPDALSATSGVDASIRLLTPGGEVVHRAAGKTDIGGRLTTAVELDPAAPPGRWTVVGSAGGTSRVHFDVLPPDRGFAPRPPLPEAPPPVGSAPGIEVFAVPEGGVLAPGIENRILVLVTLDGKPVEADVELTNVPGVKARATASATGIASLKIVPPAGDGPLKATLVVSDPDGRAVDHAVSLPRLPASRGLLVRPTVALAPPGKPLRVEVHGPAGGAVWIDVIRDGRVVLTRTATLSRGKAIVDVKPRDVGTGLVWMTARTVGEQPGFGAAPMFVPPPSPITVRVAPRKKSYVAGDEVGLTVGLADRLGTALGGHVYGRIAEVEADDGEAHARRSIVVLLLGAAAEARHAAGNLTELAGASLTQPVEPDRQWVARSLLAPLVPPRPAPRWKESTASVGRTKRPRPPKPPPPPAPAGGPAVEDPVLASPDAVTVKKGDDATLDLPTTPATGPLTATFVALSEGRLGIGSGRIPLVRPFDVEVPAPAVTSLGDGLRVPVTVRNLGEERGNVNVRIEMAPWHEIRDVQEVRLRPAAGEEDTGGFRIRTTAAGDHDLRIVVKAGSLRRVLATPMRVVPSGRSEASVRSGLLVEREATIRFAVPKGAKGSALDARLFLDPGSGAIALRAAEALHERPMRDLASVALATRALAHVVAAGVLHGKRRAAARTRLYADLQRLAAFRLPDGGWTLYRGGKADPRAAELAGWARHALTKAGIEVAGEAGKPPPTPEEPRPSIPKLLEQREADGSWGDSAQTVQAIQDLLGHDAPKVRHGEVFLELDGKPLPKVRVARREGQVVDLSEQLKPGSHTLRLVTADPGSNLPWAVSIRSHVRWSKKVKSDRIGWKVKVKTGKKGKLGKPAALSVTAKRLAGAPAGPLALRVALPPGYQPHPTDLEDEVFRGNLDGFEAEPGYLYLYLGGNDAAKASVKLGMRPTVAGSFRSPPTLAWPLAKPGGAVALPGPVVTVK